MPRAASLLLLFLAIHATSRLQAQTGTIEGYIFDSDTRTPISGATINLAAISKGENTDGFGSFRIANLAAGQYEVIASHTGYRTTIVAVDVQPDFVSRVTVNMNKSPLDLSEIRLNSKKQYGFNAMSQIDILLRPVNTSQDILRIVPGLFIAQHAGGGKAEQIFLRGFDIDHGTDIQLAVDGMPVNMVSHAHGQGYADLHFVIPETIEKLAFELGPYNIHKGNMATAGSLDFQTKSFISSNSFKIEAGQFATQRVSSLLQLFNRETGNNRQQFYIASELFRNKGYFENPQDFHRFNVMGKYTALFGQQSQLSILASIFGSRWEASGQIPSRSISNGSISRFGSIDDSEGGNTKRSNFSVRFSTQLKNNWKFHQQLYYSRYHFDLFSNFTFYLEDPVHGDAIRQKECRDLYGITTGLSKTMLLGDKKIVTDLGAGIRYDNIANLELSKVKKRQFVSMLQKGDVRETNMFAFWEQSLDLTEKIHVTGGLRFDLFKFSYRNELVNNDHFDQVWKSILSPKLNFRFQLSPTSSIFLNNGIGFHSNDSRVILNNDAKDILPKVYGTDLGMMLKPFKTLLLQATLWHLYSEQEFIYVGDAGIVEPGGPTRRLGFDLSARYQIASWLYADADMNFTRARAIGESKGMDYVPLAPSFTSNGGVTLKFNKGFSGSIRYRYMHDRPANEDYSITAKGYFINDLVANYRFGRLELFASVENLLNQEWNEAQFATESRLSNEIAPVNELHFTPGSPRFFKAGLSFTF